MPEFDPGYIGGRRVLSPLRHAYSYSISSGVVAQRPGNSVTVQWDEPLRQLILRLVLNSVFIVILFSRLISFVEGGGGEGMALWERHVTDQCNITWDFMDSFGSSSPTQRTFKYVANPGCQAM